MTNKDLEYLCHTLAKTLNSAVRICRDGVCVYYYSVYHLHPDPVTPFLPQLLAPEREAGVFATPLYQFYGYLTLRDGSRLIVGPSRIGMEDARMEAEQLFLIGVEPAQQEEYRRILHCLPAISAERMGWLVAFIAAATENRRLPTQELLVNPTDPVHQAVRRRRAEEDVSETSTAAPAQQRKLEYDFERLMLSYIQNGEPEKLEELINCGPVLKGGKMAPDTVRQVKNTCICAAAVCSRAAIAGGVDNATAFRLSDLYIQKVELTQSVPALETLRKALMLDFARQVQRIRYHTDDTPPHGEKSLFAACAAYVASNLYSPIRVEELAESLGYTRTYLCSRFKKQTGLTLTQYILQQKVMDAQRLLEFTDKGLSDIAALLGFSSQSHFQTVFKRISGQTPQSYRQQVQR